MAVQKAKTCNELMQRYITEGHDNMSAWWWARNSANPESPVYDQIETAKANAIMTELGITY